MWEFPGGKFEQGEDAEQALARELLEELNLTVEQSTPTLVIEHQYPEQSVQLHVWTVHKFSGKAVSCEGQEIKWVRPKALTRYQFPAANQPIITAARLPAYYAILDGHVGFDVEQNLHKMLDNGIRLIQLRSKNLSPIDLQLLLKAIYPLCQQAGATMLLNSDIRHLVKFEWGGVHLTSRHLLALEQRPLTTGWVAASCHSRNDLLHAQLIGVDFAVLAPVKKTKSHPDTTPIGWQAFSDLVAGVNIPVYALGGMQIDDLTQANRAGAQGIAGISAFLSS